MTTLLLSLLAAALGSVVTFLAVRHAPEGFEDESGFHAIRISRTDAGTPSHEELHSDHFAGGLA